MPKRACAGEWRGAGAGGSPQHATFFANQQFRLKLSGLQQDFRVTLTQAPLGATPKGGEHACHEMGVVVLVAPDAEGCAARKSLGKPTRDGKLGYSGVAAVCPHAFAAEPRVEAPLQLERGDYPYLLVPCTLEAKAEAAFVLEVSSNFPFELDALPRKGSLDAVAAAGAAAAAAPPPPPTAALGAADPSRGGYGAPLGGQGGEAEVGAWLESQAGLYMDELYVDADFSPEVADGGASGGEWRRPAELGVTAGAYAAMVARAAEAQLLPPPEHWGLKAPGTPGASGGGAEGAGAGSWLLGALLVLASRPELLERCFVRGAHEKRGVLAVRIWRYDRWELVLTDDRVPCVASLPQPTGGRAAAAAPLYGGCTDGAQLAPALLAKAYAKLHSSYAALRAGRITELLVDLTGGVSQKIDLDAAAAGDAAAAAAAAEQLWADLRALVGGGALVGCQQLSATPTSPRGAAGERQGVRAHVTYVVVEATELSAAGGRARLVCVRDLWGGAPWGGAWRAGAPEWTELPSGGGGGGVSALQQLQAAGSAHVGAAVAADATGAFWMAMDDFVTCFDKVYACRMFPDPTPRAVVFGEWGAASSGGCLNYASSWRLNPQFMLELPTAARVFVSLSQPSLFGPIQQRDYLPVGVCVLKGNSRRRLLVTRRENLFGASVISDTREVSFELELPPSTADRPHVIVPYTFEPGEVGEFKLSVFCEAKFSLRPVAKDDEWHHIALDGEWDAQRSGGCPNPENEHWHRNPQWSLTAQQPTNLTILLEIRPPPPPDTPAQLALGAILLSSAAGGGKKRFIGREDVISQAGFARAPVVSTTVRLDATSEPLYLLPCTFNEGEVAQFTLHLYSDAPLEVAEVPFAALEPSSAPLPPTQISSVGAEASASAAANEAAAAAAAAATAAAEKARSAKSSHACAVM